jgi:hypothetical protein
MRRVLVAFLLLAACTSSGSTAPSAEVPASGATTSSTQGNSVATTLPPEAVADIISGFTLGDVDAVYLLVDHRGEPEVVAAAREALTVGASGDQLWAATYVWSNEGTDPEPLLELLDSDDSAVRYMAAAGLIARGRSEGFGPLIAALTDENVLRGFEPAGPVWAAAATALVRYTAISANGPPFDASTAQLELAQGRWESWLESNQAGLRFDAVELIWSTP